MLRRWGNCTRAECSERHPGHLQSIGEGGFRVKVCQEIHDAHACASLPIRMLSCSLREAAER